MPESESSKIDVKLKFNNSVSVCFSLSLFVLSDAAVAFYGFDHYTIRALHCLCGLHKASQLLVYQLLRVVN